jgi:hypothetical protein
LALLSLPLPRPLPRPRPRLSLFPLMVLHTSAVGNRPLVCLKQVWDRSLPTGRVVGHLGTTITPPSLCSAPLVDMTAHLSTTSWAALLALTLGTAFPPLKSCFPRAIFSLVISS